MIPRFFYICLCGKDVVLFRGVKGSEALVAQINVTNLTFYYDGSFDNVFEDVSFSIDTDWKLGFIGRNGKGKSTFLNLLMGKYEYKGTITTSTVFDYFPYVINEEDLTKTASEVIDTWKNGCEEWKVICELNKLDVDAEVLYRPLQTLSHGERTKVMLAVLFSGENDFLLIDEPTNHLDMGSRNIIKEYLAGKSSFILVSHDRDLLDAVIDHVLVLNRKSIEVMSGNFGTWMENKERKDSFAKAENEKHLKEIGKLRVAAKRAGDWADKNEATKIGFDPLKEPERNISTRSYIGAKTKKMQSRVSSMEKRINSEIEEKEGLLNDIESIKELKLNPMEHYKKTLLSLRNYGLRYDDSENMLFDGVSFEVCAGDRVFVNGKNGCGKSSLIKAILAANNPAFINNVRLFQSGELTIAPGLVISYINQDTSFLKGSVKDFCKERNLDETLLYTVLRHLDVGAVQFAKNMEDFSEGQKKKVLIASSLITPAHLYIWDEPLNYIDVFSRMQIEALINKYKPTMLLVEHDVRFRETIATKTIDI